MNSSGKSQEMQEPPSQTIDDVEPSNILTEEHHSIAVEGSDMTRDIHVSLFKNKNRPSSRSMPQEEFIMYQDVGKASDFAKPGGFRREHIITTKQEEGGEAPEHVHTPFLEIVKHGRLYDATKQIGSAYDDFVLANFDMGYSEMSDEDEQKTPLMQQRRSHADQQKSEERGSSIKKTVFAILKSFIGSGILFLPKGFQNGGLFFSMAVLLISALVSTICMLRLASCAKALSSHSTVSYGTIGQKAFGSIGRKAVNISLVLSQIGFCCSYTIFIEKNIRDVIMHLTDCKIVPGPWLLILLQVPIYTPLTWVRKIKYFAMTNLLADLLILFGFAYIIYHSVDHMESGDTPVEWRSFNPDSWGIFIGTAVYAFEGIGLVLPIYDSMDTSVRSKFPKILSYTIFGLVTFYCFFAGIVYTSFGDETQTVVTLNLPGNGIQPWTLAVQISYSIALTLTYPLMMYPAMMILEGLCIPHGRKYAKGSFTWRKNAFRFILVCFTSFISLVCREQLDNLVSLIGGFCSVPLAFIYPCLFHSKLVGTGTNLNYFLIVSGLGTMIFSSYQAISSWGTPEGEVDYCHPM